VKIYRTLDTLPKIPSLSANIKTEEATKNALVMPLLNILGYNVSDPTEVVPEFTTDYGTKKGEKVDYAIFREGKPVILIECKSIDVDLDTVHASQLFRYFTVSEAKIGILTNGIVYRFFTDIDAPNKMDEIVTTDEEKQAYYIVKSILRENLDIKRIYIRDKKNYCGILLDDNNRKPICRLYFNSKKKYLGLSSDNKNEEKVVIGDLNDIYKCTDKLKITVSNYDNNKIQVD